MSKRREMSSAKRKRTRRLMIARDALLVDNQTVIPCFYCSTKMLEHELTIDHVIELSIGGPMYDLNNLVSCCSICNNKRTNFNVKKKFGNYLRGRCKKLSDKRIESYETVRENHVRFEVIA